MAFTQVVVAAARLLAGAPELVLAGADARCFEEAARRGHRRLLALVTAQLQETTTVAMAHLLAGLLDPLAMAAARR